MEHISTTSKPRSFTRNRHSFVHVTAEAMHRQRSLRLQTSPWEFRGRAERVPRGRRRTVPPRLYATGSSDLDGKRMARSSEADGNGIPVLRTEDTIDENVNDDAFEAAEFIQLKREQPREEPGINVVLTSAGPAVANPNEIQTVVSVNECRPPSAVSPALSSPRVSAKESPI